MLSYVGLSSKEALLCRIYKATLFFKIN